MKAAPEARELLELISLLPEGIDNRELDAIFPEVQKRRRALATLWQTSLAYNDGHNRTRVLSPIRAYMALYRQPDTPHQLSMFAYYMGLAGLSSNLGGVHGQTIVRRLTPEIGNLHSIVNLVLETAPACADENLSRGAIKAAINLSRFIRYTQLGSSDTLRLALSIAESLGDKRLQADAAFNLGWVIMNQAPDETERLAQTSLSLHKEVDNVYGQAGLSAHTLPCLRGSQVLFRMHLAIRSAFHVHFPSEGVPTVARGEPCALNPVG